MDPIIKAENLNFTYNKEKDNQFQALININLIVYPEEFIIIFGPSGCGKSSLLNVLAGLETPDSGNLLVSGKDMMKMSKNEFADYHRQKMGMIYQAYNLITSLTVLDNVALPQLFVNNSKRKREKIAYELLERFGILKQAKKIPTELSGGQQQRIGIARAIINNPELILADEPVGNLDSVSATNVLDILEDLNKKEKKTIILVTHNPENLVYGDRIIYMKDGIITREVVNRDKHKDKTLVREMQPKTITAELMDLMRAYHGLTPEQINILIMPYKSKVFAHHFITNRSMEETKVFEDIIQRRLLGTISQGELQDVLNRPTDEGGVGYDRRTADKIVRRINRVLRIAFFVYQKSRQRVDETGHHIKITIEEKTEHVLEYLLKTCYLEHAEHLNDMQLSRLRQAIKDRLSGDIQKADFYKALDMAVKEGGMGLNSKTAKFMSEELELILILGFGVVPMVRSGATARPAPADDDREPTDKPPPATPAISGLAEVGVTPVLAPAESGSQPAAASTPVPTPNSEPIPLATAIPAPVPTPTRAPSEVKTASQTVEESAAPTRQDAMIELQEREEELKNKK